MLIAWCTCRLALLSVTTTGVQHVCLRPCLPPLLNANCDLLANIQEMEVMIDIPVLQQDNNGENNNKTNQSSQQR